MMPILTTFCSDGRCDVHQCLLAVRETKLGWFDLFCPGSVACVDNGQLYSEMVRVPVISRGCPNWIAVVFGILLSWPGYL